MKITLFYKNLTVLDYAYLDPNLGVIGDSLHVDAYFVGSTDEEGVVYDFSYAKKKVKEIIDLHCDHRLVTPKGACKFHDNKMQMNYSFGLNDDNIFYEAPAEAICEIDNARVTKETLTAYLEKIVLNEMPNNIESVSLELRDESTEAGKATYHYTHGLKDHYGNCQRLFHGHKNIINIWVNGEERPDLEEDLAINQFSRNIHYCLWDNVVNKEELEKVMGKNPEGRIKEHCLVEIKYQSNQGDFFARIPGHMVYIMPIESTVENISLHFAKKIKEEVGYNNTVTVQAFEGIAKGSITTL